jgi:hypothetical protein
MNEKRLCLVSRETVVEARNLLENVPDTAVLLLGRAVMLPGSLFGDREVFAVMEEIRDLGLEGKVSPAVKALPAREIVDLLLQRRIFNLG